MRTASSKKTRSPFRLTKKETEILAIMESGTTTTFIREVYGYADLNTILEKKRLIDLLEKETSKPMASVTSQNAKGKGGRYPDPRRGRWKGANISDV